MTLLHAMQKLIIPLLLLCLFSAAACKSGKLSPVDYNKAQIRFGSGGGFTGAVTTYALLESGKLFEHQSMGVDTFTFLLQMPKADKKALFKEVIATGLDTTEYTTYGNFYYFLEWKTEADSNRVSWGQDDMKVDSSWIQLYTKLKLLTTPEE